MRIKENDDAGNEESIPLMLKPVIDETKEVPSLQSIRAYQARILAWADPFASLANDLPRPQFKLQLPENWTPRMPQLPQLPNLPQLPQMPQITMPTMPQLNVPQLNVPQLQFPNLTVPQLPELALPQGWPRRWPQSWAPHWFELIQDLEEFGIVDNVDDLLEEYETEKEAGSDLESEDENDEISDTASVSSLTSEDSDLERLGHVPDIATLNATLRNASQLLLKSFTEAIERSRSPRYPAPQEPEPLPDFDLSPDDLEPSFTPERDGLGCVHYRRNCKVQCIECQKFYPCRLCHDDVESHNLPRRETKYMLCMLCDKVSRAGQFCGNCHEEMAAYFCTVCNLWSDDPEKSIFHCDDCGICRIGAGIGIDTIHCQKCGICMNIELADNHPCIEQSANSNCPICLEYLFNSTNVLMFMSCGHPIHQLCYESYVTANYKCPICFKSIIDTSAIFRAIDNEVAREILPSELRDLRVDILCNDCRARSRVPFHVAGLKCQTCHSYNTSKV